jgi:hypothetical protein
MHRADPVLQDLKCQVDRHYELPADQLRLLFAGRQVRDIGSGLEKKLTKKPDVRSFCLPN